MAKKRKKTLKKLTAKKVLTYIVSIIVLLVGGYFAKDYILDDDGFIPISAYYTQAEGLQGEELKNQLHEIITKNIVGVNYGDARVALAEADVDPNDDTKVLTIYSRESVNRVWDSESWHREHVWPNSRLGLERVDNNDINAASDLHNLRAIVPSVNSSRSNKVFSNEITSNTYFPGDDDKGDVARILFYMVVRYQELSLVEEILENDPETNYTIDGAKMSILSLLIQWHFDDPVDDFERNRNEVIYSYQKNRNPFINHPEYVYKIFGYNTDINEYFNTAEDLYGLDLRNELHNIITNGVIGVDYGDAKEALANADVDPNDNTKVLTIYSRESVNRVWDSNSWHREHVWPNSRLGLERVGENEISAASDLHNLRAIVPGINSSRSNKVFGPETTSNTYFPGNDDKGDVARILFYMVVRYPELSLVEEILDNNPETNYTLDGAKMSILSYLLQWHYDDPVDDFERNRNEVIYSYQNNRNPFIDHPDFVYKIFYNDSTKKLNSNNDDSINQNVYMYIDNTRNDIWA